MVLGSLFSGYGGLDMGAAAALGDCRVAWHCDNNAAAAAVLDHHWPAVPNLGDITAVDWRAVEAVDVITGGSPCQDVSHAGKRAGMRAGTRSGLWASMCDAIDVLRPSLVVWENVRGVLSAEADSGVEPCPVCMGDGSAVTLRALGRVLGDLAELGYDAQWCGIRASDIGAPHGRFRVFVVATDADDATRGQRRLAAPGQAEGWRARADAGRRGGAPAADASGERHGRGEDRRSLGRVDSHDAGEARERQRAREVTVDRGATTQWGQYEPAIRRWERLTRPAPAPTEPGRTGPRLSPAFVEWLMGLPTGHVTDPAIRKADGKPLSRADQLALLGNGVVPQQAAYAVALCIADSLAGAA